MKIGQMMLHVNGHMTVSRPKGKASKLSYELRTVLAQTLSKAEKEPDFLLRLPTTINRS